MRVMTVPSSIIERVDEAREAFADRGGNVPDIVTPELLDAADDAADEADAAPRGKIEVLIKRPAISFAYLTCFSRRLSSSFDVFAVE
jgi:hypothetical protein